MTVLVTAASKHGATLEIAEAIARALEEHGPLMYPRRTRVLHCQTTRNAYLQVFP
jgi:hypothetical protein